MNKRRIVIKHHALDRLMSDRFSITKPTNKKEAIELIKKSIEHSFLIKLNDDGTELRDITERFMCALLSQKK